MFEKSVNFTIYGKPVPKGRPRMTRYGTAYTPKTTRSYEEKVRACYLNQGGINFGDAPVDVMMTFCFPIPKSWSKKKREAALRAPYCKRPDADNLAKAVLDALNGVAYTDDGQVCSMVLAKEYAPDPMTVVTITEVTGDE